MMYLIAAIVFTAIPTHQHLEIRLDLRTGTVYGTTKITVAGDGYLTIAGAGDQDQRTFTELADGDTIALSWTGVFQDDVAAGEKVGQIHNFSVNAHVSEDGVFLSDWAQWYPAPIDAKGEPLLRTMSMNVTPIDDWTCI